MSEPLVAFVVGPTASGKTDAAIALAEVLSTRGRSAEIVNADSRQVYRGMSIGTAKPTPSQLGKCPHHLIDVAAPRDGFNLAAFLIMARQAINRIVLSGGTAIVVGGTGQYIWGLVEGWDVPHVAPRPEFRKRLEAEARQSGSEALHQRLATQDPAAAGSIDPRNVRRVVRALEVIESTGSLFSLNRRRRPPSFRSVLLGLDVPRADLYSRIDRRVDAMLAEGFLDEVRGLLQSGVDPGCQAFQSVGYQEIAAAVRGEATLDEAVREIKSRTRRLVRSQANWFRANDPRIRWFRAVDALATEAASELVA